MFYPEQTFSTWSPSPANVLPTMTLLTFGDWDVTVSRRCRRRAEPQTPDLCLAVVSAQSLSRTSPSVTCQSNSHSLHHVSHKRLARLKLFFCSSALCVASRRVVLSKPPFFPPRKSPPPPPRPPPAPPPPAVAVCLSDSPTRGPLRASAFRRLTFFFLCGL